MLKRTEKNNEIKNKFIRNDNFSWFENSLNNKNTVFKSHLLR